MREEAVNGDGKARLTRPGHSCRMFSHAQAVQAAIESMQGTLQLADALMRSGRVVDFAGLDREAARLCAAVGVLPVTEAVALRPALEALVRDLDRAAVALEPVAD